MFSVPPQGVYTTGAICVWETPSDSIQTLPTNAHPSMSDAQNIHSIAAAHLFQAASVWPNLLLKHYKSARIIYPILTRTHASPVSSEVLWLSHIRVHSHFQSPAHKSHHMHIIKGIFLWPVGMCTPHEEGERDEGASVVWIEYSCMLGIIVCCLERFEYLWVWFRIVRCKCFPICGDVIRLMWPVSILLPRFI